MPTDSAGPLDPVSGHSSASSVGTSACSPYYHPLRSRSGRNNAELSVERPLLLRAEVTLAADTSGHAPEIVASPEGSVMGSVSASPHHRSLRRRTRGAYLRDSVEGAEESTFYISAHTRRSLEIQEGWKKVRDGKKKRRREEVEDSEFDEPASAGGGSVGAGPREHDEEGSGGGGGMAV